ncbi:tyrosine-type recombinase/integrase [Actinomadura sp. BRA 177]|uniref:tyrosine-type recombinase/integrase n=1 Tax=Actinomadura sp. BRA 177 TaxID=2745202 RepID=UPI001595115F|nr:tyrosine-type recombinase/integrase [Actinomadura sp. BRA 177]NVI91980.1 tyrosine-type recombinase/integrase [Actinomadura sp. BRA 177]
MMSYQVRFWSIKTVKNRRRPFGVRWIVGGQEKSEWFVTKTLAEHFRSELVQAARRGEAFDTVTGLPESKQRTHKAGSWYDHARAYTARNWSGSAAKTRATVADCLASVSRGLILDERGTPGPETLHRALATWAFNRQRTEKQTPPPEIAAALAWLAKKSVPLADLEDPAVLRNALDGMAVNLDGKPAAPKSVTRRLSVFRSCLDYAVELKVFSANPLGGVRWEVPKTAGQVDPRQVPNPEQARALLAALPVVAPRVGRHLYAFFACLYFAGLRPSEAVALRLDDCELPATGWGRLLLAGSSPASGKQWTDDGQYHQTRSLKARADGVKRPVPACPELVVILRAHVDEFGAAEDGRLFRSQRGNRLAPVSYESVWRRAREHVLTAAQLATPLAQRPYDLRHACLSLWLNGGVPAANVAARAGHSVAMLQSTYAHCIDGDEEIMNRRIDAALGAPPTPVAERAEQTVVPLPHPGARVPRSFRDYRRTITHSGSRRHTREAPERGSDAGGNGSGQVDEPSPGRDVWRLHSAG